MTSFNRAILVANGILMPAEEALLRQEAMAADLVLGVDGGTRHLLRLGLEPQVVTGDFDSLELEIRNELAARGVRLVPTPDQNFTDLDKAITVALEDYQATHLRIFAATAGRLDHVYSNLSTVLKHGRRADIRLVDEIGETFPVYDRVILTGDDLPGRTLSLMAFGTVTGITATGVVWPLYGETLAPGVRDGTLNRVTATTVEVSLVDGNLLLLLHHPAV